jgi:hypothetical protein
MRFLHFRGISRACLVAAWVLITSGPSLHAAYVTGVTATTTMGSGFSTNLQNTVNAVGLSSPALGATHGGTAPTNSWVSSSGVLTGSVTFRLPQALTVKGFSFWNQNGGGPAPGTGIRNVSISYSTDGTTFTALPGAPTLFSQVTAASAAMPQIVTFPPVSATHFRFQILSNYGDTAQTGFAEVAFDGAVNTPPTLTAPDTIVTDEDVVARFEATIVDPDGNPDEEPIFSIPTKGTISGVAGEYIYTPNINANGTDSFTITADDRFGGVAMRTVNVTITPVNDAPSFTSAPDTLMVAEDGAANFSVAAGDVDGDTVTCTAANGQKGVVSGGGASFVYTANANATGSDSFTVTATDGKGGATNAIVTVSIAPINDPPTFAIGPDQVLLEDAGAQSVPGWATGISAGPADEAAQGLVFLIITDNPQLFSVPPSIAADGTLTYTPAPDAFGITSVHVRLEDNGGTDNGGVGISPEQTFSIAINGINEVPVFSKGPDQTVLEDAGPQTVAGWATDIATGPLNEAGQALDFIVETDNAALFASPPVVAANGTLTFTTAADMNGSASVTVRLHDNGGVDNGGVDTSAPQSFLITVAPVNDPPVFSVGANQTVVQGAPARTIAGWAGAITAGPADEAAQPLQFLVEVDDPAFFLTPPAITPGGTLTFTAAKVASARVTVTVRLADNGGTADGGIDTSAAQSFVISVLGEPQLAGRYNGLARSGAGRAPGHDSVGLLAIKGSKRGTGRFSGRLTLGGEKFPFKCSVDPDGNALFGKNASTTLELKRRGGSSLSLSLRLLSEAEGDRVSGTVHDGTTEHSTLNADRAVYSKSNPVPVAVRDPTTDKCRYTSVFLAKTAPNSGLAADAFPPGDGYGLLSVKPSGVVKMVGALADGSRYSYATTLSATNRWPFYIALYKKTGSCTGEAVFRDVAGQSDLDGLGFQWFRPDRSSAGKPPERYPAGWPAGILTDLLASRFVAPAEGQSVLPALDATDADGNALFVATGHDLSVSPLKKPVNIDDADKVKIVLVAEDNLNLTLAHNGLVTGTFKDSFGGAKPSATPFIGIVFQKQQQASGFFLGPTQGGAIELSPQRPAADGE